MNNSLNIQDIIFDNFYTFYFHNVDENDFTIEKFKKIGTINNMVDLSKIINTIPTITSGMFYLMKNDVKPLWEENIKGGFWTFKLMKKDADRIWRILILNFVSNTITKNSNESDLITGISISPKINNCIIKIWTKFNPDNTNASNILNDILDPNSNLSILDNSTAFYKKHDQN